MRTVMELSQGWRFAGPGDSLEEAMKQEGEAVQIPHCWNAVDGQDGSDYLRAKCWYFKELEVPKLQADQEVWLEVMAANTVAEVYLNGQKLAHHEGGYTAFRANLTPALGESNLLAISVDNRWDARLYPQDADFTFYGGLYREVKLLVVPKAHFALGYAGGSGLKLTPKVEGTTGQLTAEVWTEGPAKTVTVTLAGEEQTAQIQEGKASLHFTVPDVHLWDGLADPYLYHVTAQLDSGDQVESRVGFRTLGFDPDKGFFLNGRSYPLRGVAKHQDRWGVGNAVTHEMLEEDMAIILELGANTLRLAHYPHHPYFYDLCDEKGLVVWAEIPYISHHVPEGRQNTLDQMKELVVQYYNHPSIVCWGLSNEISMLSEMTEDLLENHRLLNNLCHSLDATRPTVMAHENSLAKDSQLQAIPDIGSYNLYFGWYKGEVPENGEFLDTYHKLNPQRVIGLSEYGADANPAYQTNHPVCGDFTETYQAWYHEQLIQIIQERPYLWATHVWNLFDFSAARRNDGGLKGRNQKGLVTFDRKTRKDAFYLYKAHWSKEPFVHLCGSRYVDRTEDETEIKVYTNQPEVTLIVNGQQVATQKGEYVFRFQVPMAGEMKIQAKSGELEDTIQIRKVSEPNPAYIMPEKPNVLNWFDQDSFKQGYCSIKDTLGSLLENPATRDATVEICQKAGVDVESDSPMLNFLKGMRLDRVLSREIDRLDKEDLQSFNTFLQRTPKQ